MNQTFLELLAEIEDFRTGNAIHYRLQDILLVSVLAVICNMDTYTEMAMFADQSEEISGSVLRLPPRHPFARYLWQGVEPPRSPRVVRTRQRLDERAVRPPGQAGGVKRHNRRHRRQDHMPQRPLRTESPSRAHRFCQSGAAGLRSDQDRREEQRDYGHPRTAAALSGQRHRHHHRRHGDAEEHRR